MTSLTFGSGSCWSSRSRSLATCTAQELVKSSRHASGLRCGTSPNASAPGLPPDRFLLAGMSGVVASAIVTCAIWGECVSTHVSKTDRKTKNPVFLWREKPGTSPLVRGSWGERGAWRQGDKRGAGVKMAGDHNRKNFNVCVLGGVDTNEAKKETRLRKMFFFDRWM